MARTKQTARKAHGEPAGVIRLLSRTNELPASPASAPAPAPTPRRTSAGVIRLLPRTPEALLASPANAPAPAPTPRRTIRKSVPKAKTQVAKDQSDMQVDTKRDDVRIVNWYFSP
jgi:hypothetical protein